MTRATFPLRRPGGQEVAVNAWAFLAWLLAGFITGVAVTAVVMWFGRHRIRAWLSRRRGR